VRARGQATGELSRYQSPAKVWEEGDTRDDVIKRVINREMWNCYMASAMFKAITRDDRELDVIHDDVLQHYNPDELGVLTFEIEWEDDIFPRETIDINCSSTAIHNAGVTLRSY
jgi:hypothetical protein